MAPQHSNVTSEGLSASSITVTCVFRCIQSIPGGALGVSGGPPAAMELEPVVR